MRSDREQSALVDILHNIALAEDFVRDQSFETFRDDLKCFYAVTRCLEIISEASRRLSDALKQRHPDVAWREMAGQGMSTVTITKMWPRRTFGARCASPCRRCARLSNENWA